MYKIIKLFLKTIFPKPFLFHNEWVLRYFLFLVYKGNQFECTICKKQLRKFIVLEGDDKLCPRCGSLSRNRRLYHLLESGILQNGQSILDFSPSRCFYRILKQNKSIYYSSTDLSGDFIADEQFDITKINSPDKSFNLIICYHILEHIVNDSIAIAELERILKHDGICLIQTPFKPGNIYEDFSISSKEQRTKYFGQDDHVRIYSVEGLKERLQNSGFNVNVMQFTENENNRSGFSTSETILLCKKN